VQWVVATIKQSGSTAADEFTRAIKEGWIKIERVESGYSKYVGISGKLTPKNPQGYFGMLWILRTGQNQFNWLLYELRDNPSSRYDPQ
jgi:hypothetical protein